MKSRPVELPGLRALRASASGRAWVVADFSRWWEVPPGRIVVAERATPETVLLMEDAVGLVFATGGPASHGAILAREFERPCLVGVRSAVERIASGSMVEIDSEREVARVFA